MPHKPTLIGIATLLVVVAIYLLWPRAAERAPADKAPPPAVVAPVNQPAPISPLPPRLEQPRATTPGTIAPPENPAAAMAQARDGYVRFAEFPPWSRPATPAYAELYQFNQSGPEHEQAIGAVADGEIHARLALDMFFVEAGRPATIVAECWKMKDGVRHDIDYTAIAEVHVAESDSDEDPSTTTAFMHGYRAVGDQLVLKDGSEPAVRTGTLDVSAIAELSEAPRSARLIVYFDPEGGDLRPLALNFAYSTSSPLEIVSLRNEGIADGSLALTLDVDVAEAVPIRVRAALAPAGNRDVPIAIYDDWFRPTQAGPQEMTIRIFGRILRQAEIDGPYELFALHGTAYFAAAPVTDVFWQSAQSFRTKPYHARDFAVDEWESPEKEAKLRNYAKAIDSLQTPGM